MFKFVIWLVLNQFMPEYMINILSNNIIKNVISCIMEDTCSMFHFIIQYFVVPAVKSRMNNLDPKMDVLYIGFYVVLCVII